MASFVRYNVYLSPDQLKGLHSIYDREGTRVSEQVRRALDTWLIEKGELAEKTRVPFKTVVPKSRRRKRTAR